MIFELIDGKLTVVVPGRRIVVEGVQPHHLTDGSIAEMLANVLTTR